MLFRGRKLPVKEEPKRNTTKRQTQQNSSIASISPIVSQDQPFIGNAAMVLEPIDNTFSTITTPQNLRNVLSPMSPIGIDNINPEPEDTESGRFLASLIAQGAAGFGAGMMGGSSQDILRSTGIFDRMRESDINRQDRLRQNELLRDERLGEKQDKLSELKRREEQAKQLTDPNSEESKRKREVYKSLGFQVPNNLSATDLNEPTVLQTLKTQMQEQKLAAMPKGGIGAGKVKEEKPKDRKLSQDERALLNNSALAYKALFDMEKAIKEGKSRSTILGDNEYTYAANRFVEGIGRMQSGGAIGSEEAENFKRLIPGRFDNEKLSKQKIQDMKAELEARLKSINFDPKEILQSRTPSIDFSSEE